MINDLILAYREAIATFRGSEWLSYDLTEDALSSYDDEITLSFRTRHPNGLLLHTGGVIKIKFVKMQYP